jgi:hypothetical protein
VCIGVTNATMLPRNIEYPGEADWKISRTVKQLFSGISININTRTHIDVYTQFVKPLPAGKASK